MVTWGLLTIAGGPKVFVMNTHFPYGKNADSARLEAAELVRQKMRDIDPKLLIVLTGDFNAAPVVFCHTKDRTGEHSTRFRKI
jgi:endonuclease/exonuclease/phosphatase family metal-dependent hydrolase